MVNREALNVGDYLFYRVPGGVREAVVLNVRPEDDPELGHTFTPLDTRKRVLVCFVSEGHLSQAYPFEDNLYSEEAEAEQSTYHSIAWEPKK